MNCPYCSTEVESDRSSCDNCGMLVEPPSAAFKWFLEQPRWMKILVCGIMAIFSLGVLVLMHNVNERHKLIRGREILRERAHNQAEADASTRRYFQQRREEQVAAATPHIKLIDPRTFPDLPAHVLEQLEKSNCRIPQASDIEESPEPNNAIKGNFARKDQEDWAVLCSSGGASSIFMFWGGNEQCSSEIARADDYTFLQNFGDGKRHYSRSIYTMTDKEHIAFRFEAYGGAKAPLIDHDAIGDVYLEKAESAHYCRESRWHEGRQSH